MNVPDELRYSADHEWARTEGDRVRIGITDYAQDALGDVVFVDLPTPGAKVDAGGVLGEVESTKSVSEVYAPLAGEVVAVNSALADAPECSMPIPTARDGSARWCRADPSALDALLDAEWLSPAHLTADNSNRAARPGERGGWERLPWSACSAPPVAIAIRPASTSVRHAARACDRRHPTPQSRPVRSTIKATAPDDESPVGLLELPVGSASSSSSGEPDVGVRFPLETGVTQAGRHPESDIFLDDITVSRRHAEFVTRDQATTVRDVGSLNGTFVNRERIEEARLSSGDEVQIGKFKLLYVLATGE